MLPLPELVASRPVRFVLSAGRTGTMFLTSLVDERFDNVHCVHEPSPSRALLVGGNLRNLTGLGTGALQKTFESALSRRLAQLESGTRYIEVNPMLCPVTDLLRGFPGGLHVLHLVRDPRTWASSMRVFKASGFRRHVIDYVPIAKVMPVPLPSGWTRLDHMRKSLWEWRARNAMIMRIRNDCDTYTRLRYEDLFSKDIHTQRETLHSALEGLGLDPSKVSLDTEAPQRRVNPAPRNSPRHEPDPADVAAICGELMQEFGYTPP